MAKVRAQYILAVVLLGVSVYMLQFVALDTSPPVRQPQVLAIEKQNTFDELTVPTPAASPTPVQTGKETPPIVSALAVTVIDEDTGKVLYEKNAEKKIYPASTTKIMTAMIALENYRQDDVITFKTPNNIATLMKLTVGEQITVKNMLYGMLMLSANDAALSLAADGPLGLSSFISRMNSKAQELGMINTQFTNSSGLHSTAHYSTAYDLAVLSQYAMKNPLFRDIVKTKSTIVTDLTGTKKHNLYNIDKLVTDGYADGIKTGTTPEAGQTVISSRTENNHRVIAVVVDSKDRFGEARKLLEYTFRNFSWDK